jgi:small subunit ribosomal protein S8
MGPIPNLASHISNSFKNGYRRISIPFSNQNQAISKLLYDQGFISTWMMGDHQAPFANANIPITPENIHSRRIWLDLKYRQGQPALSEFKIISKPSRRVFATVQELQALGAAKRVNSLIKRRVLGQITIMDTVYGIVELNDALRKRVGGEVLAICY